MVSGRLFSLAISSLHLLSQRVVRSIEASTYFLGEGFSMHSSNAMAIVEPRFDCICILSSGPMKMRFPSIWEAK